MNSEPKSVNLLWTSGLDSTFRLLELLFIQKKIVQPYYILDRSRKSLEMEIRAMEKIREEIYKKDPNCKLLLKPNITKELSTIKDNQTITETYKRVYSEFSIGAQNEWLAKFAEETQIDDLELSIESRVNFTHPFNKVVIENLETEVEGSFYNYKLKKNPTYEGLSLFKNFKFPLIKKTKVEMLRIAKENGFLDILNHTWFCHSPVKEKPCGICKPCRIAIGEGLWKKIPIEGLIRNFKVYKIRPLVKRV